MTVTSRTVEVPRPKGPEVVTTFAYTFDRPCGHRHTAHCSFATHDAAEQHETWARSRTLCDTCGQRATTPQTGAA